ncbi:hypothetical protein [Haloarchaeobius litoreus]|uniref:Uncharacterized protein n=1 Tax=Haloarchaeobius litoreus TaxID=755306 RepID=A0ABD6DH50_9EURY|nr:hypothetical protein [Haloarchaeobius litoreus]
MKIEEPEVTRYPKNCYSVEQERRITSQNLIAVRIPVRNNGLKNAQDCSARVEFSNVSNSFETRWNETSYPHSISISRDSRRLLDVFWLRPEDNTILTASPERETSFDYPKEARHEIRPGEYIITISVSAANMPEQEFKLSLGGEAVEIPNNILDFSKDADIIDSIRMEERYAIVYSEEQATILEVPNGMDLSELEVFKEFGVKDRGRPFAAWAGEKYDIRRK